MEYWIYLAIMAGSTYLIRSVPFALMRKKITNPFIRSFLYYIPYAVLTAMTFPAILNSTASVISGAAALLVAVWLAFRGKSLIVVALGSCGAVFLTELLMGFMI